MLLGNDKNQIQNKIVYFIFMLSFKRVAFQRSGNNKLLKVWLKIDDAGLVKITCYNKIRL